MRFHFLLYFLFIAIVCTNAQDDLKIGQWQSYLPFQKGTYVTQSEYTIYYASNLSVMLLDRTDFSVRYLSTVTGLSDIEVGVIKYNPYNSTLMITYQNGNIDLRKFQEITNIPFVLSATSILGNKAAKDIYFQENDAYIVYEFGLVKLNMEREEIDYTTFTGTKPTNFQIFNGNFYLTTEEGIYRTSASNANPADFGTWDLMGTNEGLPMDYSATAMRVYNDKLYLGVNNTSLYRFDGNTADSIYSVSSDKFISYLSAEGKHLLMGVGCNSLDGCSAELYSFDEDESFETTSQCMNKPVYAVEDRRDRIWFADQFRDFRTLSDINESCTRLSYNTPYSENVNKLRIIDEQVWIASGGIEPNQEYLWRADGFFSFIDGKWNVYNNTNQNALSGLVDFYDIAIHPANGKIYASSFLDGLVELDGETFTVFNDSNSNLGNAAGDVGRTRVSGLAFDANNDLWIGNHSTALPISVYRNDGTWQSYNICGSSKNLLEVVIDPNGYKWFINGGGGLVVFYEGDEFNPSDCRTITTSNSALETNNINSIAVDLEGDVWVGTSQGAYVFECGAGVFDASCIGARRIVEEEGIPAYLLETEDVQAIAIDGANRKWFGTTNGVFVQSADGQEKIAFFDKDNSPLFDNSIIDIAIMQSTGDVFIATNKGLISYRSDAIEGGKNNNVNAYAYPNPVRPDYDGPIAIKGLARDANVKITDVNGQLIYETKALGGQAIWDGRDYNGRKASSGVYLVMSTNTDNLNDTDAVVTKILLMN